jgi:hypothetical protein
MRTTLARPSWAVIGVLSLVMFSQSGNAQPGVALTCDVPVVATISSPLETDVYTFAVNEGDRVQISVLERAPADPGFNAMWRLLTAGGLPAASCGAFGIGTQFDCGPLPASGSPYRLEVAEFGQDQTGTYSVHLYPLPAASACENVALGCDVPLGGRIDPALDSDFYSFSVTDGDRVQITVLETAPFDPGFNAMWRLLTATGQPAASCGAFGIGSQFDCGPLPASGNPYRLEVADFSRSRTGNYTVHLYTLPAATACESTSLACDVTLSATIERPLDSDFYSFAATDGARLQVSVIESVPSEAGFNAMWRLLTATGQPAASCGAFGIGSQFDCGPLPASGNPYRLEVADFSRQRTGTYSVRIHPLTGGCLAVPPFTISGRVSDLNGTGVGDVTMTLTGSANAIQTSDVSGLYAFTNLQQGGTYTVTPSRATFGFTPPSATFANLQGNETASFLATAGTFTRYLAEGATGSFFDTEIALLNASGSATVANVQFQREDGVVVQQSAPMAGIARATINPETLPGLQATSLATSVQSTQPLIVDRLMRWDASGYGSHAETSVGRPETVWYLAEGATTGSFNLYYLLQNPSAQAAQVEVRYLRPAPHPPIVRNYTVGAASRQTIYVNDADPALAEADVSAVITSTNGVPVIVERAMYTNAGGLTFGAGHESAAVPLLATSWFLAEGATGPFFHLFILVVNPGTAAAELEARYLLPGGGVVTRTYTANANSRLTISVHAEGPELAATPVSTIITSTNGVPVLVERAMWWPATAPEWYEGHNSAGAVATGEKWGLAAGEVGPGGTLQTYVLIANTSATAGDVSVRLIFEDGSTAEKVYTLLANSRFNVFVNAEFPSAAGRRFGAIVESLGPSPVQIVVERAMYSDAQGVTWAAGSNSMGTRLR